MFWKWKSKSKMACLTKANMLSFLLYVHGSNLCSSAENGHLSCPLTQDTFASRYWGNCLIVSSCSFLLVYLFPCSPFPKQSVRTCEHLCQTSPVFMDLSRTSLLHWHQRNFTWLKKWKLFFAFTSTLFCHSHVFMCKSVWRGKIRGKGRRLFLKMLIKSLFFKFSAHCVISSHCFDRIFI